MNLIKLFETQKILDTRIMEKHPELVGQNNIDWKILALQVELGECANEWRGFKKWSNDQKPRTEVLMDNPDKTDKNKPWVLQNLLLEEYVDCLHFFLSIGLESNTTPIAVDLYLKSDSISNQFLGVFASVGDMSRCLTKHNYCQALEKFIGLGEMLGFTWEQIDKAYYDKNAINHTRQDTGY